MTEPLYMNVHSKVQQKILEKRKDKLSFHFNCLLHSDTLCFRHVYLKGVSAFAISVLVMGRFMCSEMNAATTLL